MAWSNPDTRAWIRRSTVIGAVGAVVGALLLIWFVLWLGASDREYENLLADGAHSEGTVVETHSSRHEESITVRLSDTPVDDVVINVGLASDYREGQTVMVFYDPDRLDRFVTLHDSDDPQSLLVLAVVGGGAAIFGTITLVRVFALRLRLRRHPWRRELIEVGIWEWWFAGGASVRLRINGTPLALRSTLDWRRDSVFGKPGRKTMWVCGPARGLLVPVATVGGGELFVATASLTGIRNAWWSKYLLEQPAGSDARPRWWHSLVWVGASMVIAMIPAFLIFDGVSGRTETLPVVRIDDGWCYYLWPGGPPLTSDDAGDECPSSVEVGDVRKVWISWENILWNERPLTDNLIIAIPVGLVALGLIGKGGHTLTKVRSNVRTALPDRVDGALS